MTDPPVSPVSSPGGVVPPLRSAPPLDVMPPPGRWRRVGGWSGWIPIALGAWLLVSVFLWPHAADVRVNAWLVGALLLGFGALTLYKPRARWASAVLATWLAISTLATDPVMQVTAWNHVLVALGVLAATLAPPRGRAARRA